MVCYLIVDPDPRTRNNYHVPDINPNASYALGKALEWQYFKFSPPSGSRTEWHQVLDWHNDDVSIDVEIADGDPGVDYLRLEGIRRRLVQALELFPRVAFDQDLFATSMAAIKFDRIMEEISVQQG
ncbi:hypothetical protein BDW69DRAFT_180946 [Aspergillus filifer]